MAAIPIPFIIGGVEALLVALGITTAVTVATLAANSNLPAKVI